MTYKSSMTIPAHYAFLFVLFISMPLVAQEEVKKEDESEVAVVPDADGIEDPGLKAGNVAPSWALMYAPAKFEFLKNWTVERGARLRKSTTQPYRHVVVVSFFATWCVPCAKEIPELTKLSKQFGDEFQFLLVDVNEKRDKVKEHVLNKGISLPVVLDKYGKTFEKFGGKTLPLLVVVNKDGLVSYHHTGYKSGDELLLKEHLESL